MFNNCTIKYSAKQGVNTSILVTYPTVDGATPSLSVPMDEDNIDYQNILEWVAEGNTIAEAD